MLLLKKHTHRVHNVQFCYVKSQNKLNFSLPGAGGQERERGLATSVEEGGSHGQEGPSLHFCSPKFNSSNDRELTLNPSILKNLVLRV